MKQTYYSPVMQMLDLVNEDILTSSPLSTRNATDAIDEINWADFF